MLNFRLDNNNDLNFNLESVEREDFELQKLLFNVIVGAVTSVNGQTGDVTIDIPTKISQLTNDSGYITTSALIPYATKEDIKVVFDDETFETSQEFADTLIGELSGTFNEIFNNLETKEQKSYKTSTIGQGSTINYPNTKAVYDYVEPVKTNVSNIQGLIPNQATTSNQLADKAFVNSSVQTATANFRGNWDNYAQIPTNANDYPQDYAGNKTPTVNDYLVVQDASDYTLETLTGTWRFKYTGTWTTDGKAGWHPEYQVNETPLTAAQLAALNSGITSEKVTHMVLDSDLATVATSGSYNDLINTPTPNLVIELGVDMGTGDMIWSGADSIATVRTAYENGAGIKIKAPLLTDEIYNITECWWENSDHDKLWLQTLDNDLALLQIGIRDDNSVDYTSTNIQEKLSAGTGINISGNTISATSSITVDSALDNNSPNPVQNQALYPAIVGSQLTMTIPANSWSDPSGGNTYNSVAIVTLPSGSFTDNSLLELLIDDQFNLFAKHGFILYGHETESQRIWLTSIGKPASTVYLKLRIYKYGS